MITLSQGPLLHQRIQRLVERVRDDCAHRLVPRPIRFPKQVKERLLTILHGRKSIIRYERIFGEVGLAGSNDHEIVRAVGVNSVGVDCEGVVVERFEVDRLRLGLLRWPAVGRVAWERGTG